MTGAPAMHFLGRDIRDFLSIYLPTQSSYIVSIIRDIKHQDIANKILEVSCRDQEYILHLSQVNSYIHWEWERKTTDDSGAFHMHDIAHVLESSNKSLWHKLAENIYQILEFDRVHIYQIYENNTSEVIAEYVKDKSKSLLGSRFSADFYHPDDLKNHLASPYRYVPDLFAPHCIFHELADEHVDVIHSHLYPLPLLHRDFARSLGAKSLIAFPLVANGRLWGILIAYSSYLRNVHLQKRQLCQLICTYAAKRQESNIKNNLLAFQENIHDTLQGIRNDLLANANILLTLSKHLPNMQRIVQADGIVICNSEEMHVHGIVPSKAQIIQVADLIRTLKNKSLFLDSNFRLRYADQIDGDLNFAGVMALKLGKESEIKIMWFRQEDVDLVYQVVPLCQDLSPEAHGSDETLYTHETWRKQVTDTAKSWNTNDLYFAEHLRALLQDTLLAKSEEKDRINQKLILLNNELEMLTFTLSHDLKNPLSVVKLCSQMLSRKAITPSDKRWIDMLLDGVEDIESMLDSVLSVGKSKVYHFEQTEIPMAQMIEKIVTHSKLVHDCGKTKVVYDELIPIWGERNLLHQIFQNIIGNAVKYSKNRKNPYIHIRSFKKEFETIYEIQDNGIGIPANELENIFHVHKRSSNVGKIAGTGVGLALVRRILDRLQAGILLESTTESGTKVTLTFKTKPPVT